MKKKLVCIAICIVILSGCVTFVRVDDPSKPSEYEGSKDLYIQIDDPDLFLQVKDNLNGFSVNKILSLADEKGIQKSSRCIYIKNKNEDHTEMYLKVISVATASLFPYRSSDVYLLDFYSCADLKNKINSKEVVVENRYGILLPLFSLFPLYKSEVIGFGLAQAIENGIREK